MIHSDPPWTAIISPSAARRNLSLKKRMKKSRNARHLKPWLIIVLNVLKPALPVVNPGALSLPELEGVWDNSVATPVLGPGNLARLVLKFVCQVRLDVVEGLAVRHNLALGPNARADLTTVRPRPENKPRKGYLDTVFFTAILLIFS